MFGIRPSQSEEEKREVVSHFRPENDIYYDSYHIGYMTWCALYGEAEVLTQMTEPRTMSYAEDGSGANMLHYIFTMPRLPGLILCLTHVRSLGRIYLLA